MEQKIADSNVQFATSVQFWASSRNPAGRNPEAADEQNKKQQPDGHGIQRSSRSLFAAYEKLDLHDIQVKFRQSVSGRRTIAMVNYMILPESPRQLSPARHRNFMTAVPVFLLLLFSGDAYGSSSDLLSKPGLDQNNRCQTVQSQSRPHCTPVEDCEISYDKCFNSAQIITNCFCCYGSQCRCQPIAFCVANRGQCQRPC